MGRRYRPITHVTNPDLLTHLTHDPWPNDPCQLCGYKIAAKFVQSLEHYETGTGLDNKELENCKLTWKYETIDIFYQRGIMLAVS